MSTALTTAALNLAAAGAQSANNTANSFLNSGVSIYNTKKTNEANMKLAEYAYQQDYQQWLREMEYNTPANQMKRYLDAGLNPNLIYSQGNPGNSSVSSPQYKAPHLQYQVAAPQLDTMLSQVGQILGMYNNSRLVDAQVAEKESRVMTEKARQNLMSIQALRDAIYLEGDQKYYLLNEDEKSRQIFYDTGYKQHQSLNYQKFGTHNERMQHDILQYQRDMHKIEYQTKLAEFNYLKKTGQLGYRWLNNLADTAMSVGSMYLSSLGKMSYAQKFAMKNNPTKYLKTAEHTYKNPDGSYSKFYDYLDY